jgi:hypothetical protein
MGLRAGLGILRTDKRLAAAYIRTPDLPAHTVAALTAVPDSIFRVIFQSQGLCAAGHLRCSEVVKLIFFCVLEVSLFRLALFTFADFDSLLYRISFSCSFIIGLYFFFSTTLSLHSTALCSVIGIVFKLPSAVSEGQEYRARDWAVVVVVVVVVVVAAAAAAATAAVLLCSVFVSWS